LGIGKHVIFYNRFVEIDELTEFLGAADIYVTPYLNPAQITSGTLAYAFGCGKAVISTPYWYAEELLAENRGRLVPFGDSAAIAHAMIDLLHNETDRHAMRKRAYLAGREMIWNRVADRYMQAFHRARHSRVGAAPRPAAPRTLDARPFVQPRWRLDHLLHMTDSTGMFQHACYTIPNFCEGYCTDDNARALLLTVLLEEAGPYPPEVRRAATTYAAFLNGAFDAQQRRFRNFLGFDRRWLESTGSDDCQGRALWALGACIGRSRRRDLQRWAMQIFDRALPAIPESPSPRTWAFTLLGIHEYFRRLSGDRLVNQIRETLTSRLVTLFEQAADKDWLWFEDMLSYDNARLPHALILSGRWTGNAQAMDVGLRSLRWLADIQRSPRGCFRPIGCKGFCPRGQQRADFDQQPIEAYAMTSASIEAYRVTDDPFWLDEARRAFEWFLGSNDLGVEVYDSASGGCRDGLREDRLNENQGAESTLAFLLALAEIQLLETTLASFRHADVNGKEVSASVPIATVLTDGH
jgi:hypothetical protein